MSLVLDRNPVTTARRVPKPGVRVRRMTRADAAALDDTFEGLSERSRFLRYHAATPRLTARMRRALLDVDDDARHLAYVAEIAAEDDIRAIGIARLLDLGGGRAEIAVEVVDAWHRHGVGSLLLDSILREAARLGYAEVHADVLPENRPMRRLLGQVFPDAVVERGDGSVRIRDWVGATLR
jgi:RimJ/RimL family protein N-acetyltransferase